MNVTKIGKSTKIEAESELTIYSVNNFVYKPMFIISSKDSIDNYEEMTVEEAAERAYSVNSYSGNKPLISAGKHCA